MLRLVICVITSIPSGPGMFNVTVLVILVLSSIANYFREKRESDLKANENARKARAEARHAKKHKQ